MARPSGLTPDVAERLLTALRGGNYRQTACRLVGISPQTLIRWERNGEDGQEPYASFLPELHKAEAEGEEALLATVRAGDERWQSAAWILERKYPAKWGNRVRVAVHEEMSSLMRKLQERDGETYLKVLRVITEEDSGLAAPDAPAAAADEPAAKLPEHRGTA